MNLNENILRVKELMGIREEEENSFCSDPRFGDFTTDFEHPDLDLKKLVDVGAVFVTKAVGGDPNDSITYKKIIPEQGHSIITLFNYKCDSPDGWIRFSVENAQTEVTEEDQSHLDFGTYKGKYEQIYWSLDQLGVSVDDVLK